MRNTNAQCVPFAATLALAALLTGSLAHAQNYPARPIQVIVPFAGGSASDVVTRILLEHAAKTIGQPFIIDNRPGAGGNTGTQAAAHVTPDGYTLVATGSGSAAINKILYRDLGYDPQKDFEPISLVGIFPIVVVASAQLPVKSLADLIAYAKPRPGELNYGSVGIGSSQHLSGVYFGQITGTKLTHVPYRNIAQYAPDLISGAVPLGFQWLPNVQATLDSGGARALAVAARTRMAALPNVPTAAEAGLPNYESSGWFVMWNAEADRRQGQQRAHRRPFRSRRAATHHRAGGRARDHDSGAGRRVHGGGNRQVARHHQQSKDSADTVRRTRR